MCGIGEAGCSEGSAAPDVKEWEELFSSGPSPRGESHFVTGTPRRLFEALRGQIRLFALAVKWGDDADHLPSRR